MNDSKNTPIPQHLNNIYFIDAGESFDDESYTMERDVGLFVAPTRAKAKYDFLLQYGFVDEWTAPISIRLVARAIALPVGEAPLKAWLFVDDEARQFPLLKYIEKQHRIPTSTEHEYIIDALCKTFMKAKNL